MTREESGGQIEWHEGSLDRGPWRSEVAHSEGDCNIFVVPQREREHGPSSWPNLHARGRAQDVGTSH